MVSRADAAACPVKPGKKQANELLKECRQRIPYGKEHVGQIVSILDVASDFSWEGWLAGQAQAGGIFKSKETGGEVSVISCFVEAFPEREPNSGKLPLNQSHLRVDIVCERSDGSAIRLHPHKNGKDALIRTGFLAEWRIGIKESGGGGQAIPVNHDAVEIARRRQPPPPTGPPPHASSSSELPAASTQVVVQSMHNARDGLPPESPQLLNHPIPSPLRFTMVHEDRADSADRSISAAAQAFQHQHNNSMHSEMLAQQGHVDQPDDDMSRVKVALDDGPPETSQLAPPSLEAREHFDGVPYGPEYLTLQRGDQIVVCPWPQHEPLDARWTFGFADGRGPGWFPADFVGAASLDDTLHSSDPPLISIDSEAGDEQGSEISYLTGSSDQHEHCFSPQTNFKNLQNHWIPACQMKQFDYVVGEGEIPVQVMSVESHLALDENMVEISAGRASLLVTSSHRVMVQRGGQLVPAPASSVRVRDDIFCRYQSTTGAMIEGTQAVTQIKSFIDTTEVIQISFRPNLSVQAINIPEVILPRGHSGIKTRRSGMEHRGRREREASIPETFSSFD